VVLTSDTFMSEQPPTSTPPTPAPVETVNVTICFVCTIERMPEFVLKKGTVAQEHGKVWAYELSDVPVTEFVDGRPSGRVLEFAEREFMARLETIFPEHDVIVWEARLGSPTGTVLSRYEMYAR
jgi:hypothetical protein